MHLEQYLLSLYRKAFDGQLSTVSPPAKDEKIKSPITTPIRRLFEVKKPNKISSIESSAVPSGCQSIKNTLRGPNRIREEESLLDSSVQRCHSSLSQCSALHTRNSPTAESMAKAVRACHSQPLSMMEVIAMHSPLTFLFLCLLILLLRKIFQLSLRT